MHTMRTYSTTHCRYTTCCMIGDTQKQVIELQKVSSNPNIHPFQLDLTDKQSISNFVKDIASQYSNNITCLVNNAGIYVDKWNQSTFDRTLQTNIFGPMAVTQGLLSNGCFADISQIVNVSSGYGSLSHVSQTYASILTDKCKSSEDLRTKLKFDASSKMKTSYVGAYKLSKAMLNRYTQLLAQEIQRDIDMAHQQQQKQEEKTNDDVQSKSNYALYRRIYVNCVCPGWVRTDMGGASATRSVEQGAASIMWFLNQDLAHNKQIPNGCFLRDGKVISFL